MGACGVAALVVLLLASALLPTTASSRVLEGEASSGEGAPAPTTVAAGGSSKSGSSKESGQSSPPGQQEAPPPTTVTKDSKQPSTGEGEKKGHAEGGAQASATSPPPPPPVKKKDGQKESPSPPPGASGPNGGGEGKGGTAGEDKGSKGKDEATNKLKEVMDKCDASHNCTVGEEFFACLQVPDNAATESVVLVLNKGQNLITVNVKESPGIEDIDRRTLQLAKGAYKQMVIKNISPRGGNITLYNEHGDYCSLHVSQSVSNLQRQFQQFAKYATRLNPIYGAYLFGFTVVLVGVVCLCCKFARRRGNGVSYQQLEMSAPAPNSSGADNTISTADGWDDGWDDDWDDEEAPARPPDKKPASSVSANGLSLRSHTDNKDGWDVDWDD